MPLLETDANIACITCSEAPFYIYQIMRLNTGPKVRLPKDTQCSRDASLTSSSPPVETRAEAAKVGNHHVLLLHLQKC